MPVKIFLIEDHELVRQGIKALLEGEPDIMVTGEASNGEEALQKLKTESPDVLLVDMNMPVMNGMEFTRMVRQSHPHLKVLILSMHDHESYLLEMLSMGADGYILKNSSKEELVFAIKRIAAGAMYIGPEFTLNMLARYAVEKSSPPPASATALELSDREKDVLELIAEGLTNVEISNRLFTSVRTIETRRKKLLEKTGTNNTATLIKFAVKNGLIR